ncbi:MAG: hypothetical protein EPO35_10300 [Acidobacteria bacterium]|nr:MAG: hypothetical protein EPO35_10300 [Acidobacteriota bacterium]
MRNRTLATLVVVVLWSMSTHGKPSSSGDEPHYLMVARSLVADHDLDVANNYANGEGRLVGADGLTMGPHARVNAKGHTWSVHDVGLSVLAAPAFAAGSALANRIDERTLARFRQSRGLFAYSVVSVFLIFLTAIGASLLNSALREIAPARHAAIVTLCVAFSPPVLPHSFLVFPEAPALALTCLALWIAYRPDARLSTMTATWGALAIGLMPWFHRKFSFFVLALAFAIWRHKREWFAARAMTVRAGIAAVFIAPQLGLHLFTWINWGQIGGPQLEGLPFSLAGILVGVAGLLLDRSRGLLPYSPLAIVAIAAWVMCGRRFVIWLLPIAALFLPLAAYATWNAGYSPAARFLVPLMPLLALPAVEAMANRTFRRVALAPLALQIALSANGWQHPRALWPGEVGENRLYDVIPGFGQTIARIFPVLDHGSWKN